MLFPWNKCLHTSIINCKDTEKTKSKNVAYRTAGRKKSICPPLRFPWTTLMASDFPRLPLAVVPLTRPDADIYPWASVSALPWPSLVPREVLSGQVWGCVHLLSAWESGIDLVLPPLVSPHPPCTLRKFPILSPCCRISTLNASTNAG